MSEVNINYKGSTIASMDASGTKTLQTSGKYCEDDVEVVYTRPSSGGGYVTQDANGYVVLSSTNGVPTLITKSITANGAYNASSDSATGYSSVTVNVQSSPQLSAKYGTGSREFDFGSMSYKWKLTFTGFSAAPSMFFLKLNTGLEDGAYSYSPLSASGGGTDYLYMVIDGVYMQGTSQFFGKVPVTGDYRGEYALLENNGNSCITWSYSGGTLTFTCQSTFNNYELCFASNNSSTGDYILYYA